MDMDAAGRDAALMVDSSFDFGSLWAGDDSRGHIHAALEDLRFLSFAEESLRPDVVGNARSLTVESRSIQQAKKDMSRDVFVINNEYFLGSELGAGLVDKLQEIMERVLLDAGMVLDKSSNTDAASFKTLADCFMVKASRSNSGYQSLLKVYDLVQFGPGNNGGEGGVSQLKPVALSDRAQPLVLRVRVAGSGQGSVALECTCKCTTYYQLKDGDPDPDADVPAPDAQNGQPILPILLDGQLLSLDQLRGRVLRVCFEDSVSLPLSLLTSGLGSAGASAGVKCVKPDASRDGLISPPGGELAVTLVDEE